MKSKTSTEYYYVTSIEFGYLSNSRDYNSDRYENKAKIPAYHKDDIVGGYLFFDGEYYGPIRAVKEDGPYDPFILTDFRLPKEMQYEEIEVYEKESVTTTTYPPFYHKAKKGQSLYVKKNGAIGNEPDVYVKTGGKIKKLY